MTTLIGTCGYSYKDWIGPFYPAGTKDSLMLDYKCQSIVDGTEKVYELKFEINSSKWYLCKM